MKKLIRSQQLVRLPCVFLAFFCSLWPFSEQLSRVEGLEVGADMLCFSTVRYIGKNPGDKL